MAKTNYNSAVVVETKAGRDFKAHLHPRMIGGRDPIRGLLQTIFFPKPSLLYDCIILILLCHYDYLTSPDTILDRPGSNVIPNESEQASVAR